MRSRLAALRRVGVSTVLLVALVGLPRVGTAQQVVDPIGSPTFGRTLVDAGGLRVQYFPPPGGGGPASADPDTWEDDGPPGWFRLSLTPQAHNDAPGAPGCTTSVTADPPLDYSLPSMWIRTDPAAPKGQDGQGGVVGVPTMVWIEGYAGESRTSPQVHAHVVNCVPGPIVDGVLHARADEHDYTAQVTYSPTTPVWSFGDPAGTSPVQSCASVSCPPGAGWSPALHTYLISSVNGGQNWPGRGPSFTISFSMGWNYRVITDVPGGARAGLIPDGRARVYPVRQVESLLTD